MAFFALPAIPAIVEGILWLGGGAAVAGAAHQALPGKEQREQSIANAFGGSSSPPNEAMMMQDAKDGAGADATPTAGTDAASCLGECPPAEQKSRKRYDKDGNEIISEERAGHILDGDRTGGGHRAGTGTPGKSEFPASWDDDKILDGVSDVAQNGQVIGTARKPGNWIKNGTVDGVDIHVVVDGAGKVTSGWPVSGHGVKINPRY